MTVSTLTTIHIEKALNKKGYETTCKKKHNVHIDTSLVKSWPLTLAVYFPYDGKSDLKFSNEFSVSNVSSAPRNGDIYNLRSII